MVRHSRTVLAALSVLASACVGSIGGGGGKGGGTPPGSGGGTPGGGPGNPGNPGPGNPGNQPPPGGVPPIVDPPASCAPYAPWRTTTLTREQYINAAGDLLGLDVRPLLTLADVGNRKFSPGVSLTALQIEQRMTTAEAIAAAATAPAQLPRVLPCDPAQGGEDACAAKLVAELGARAFRRPLAVETTTSLRKLFDAGKAAGGFATGAEWLIAGLLQAPDFLYHLSPRPAGATPGKAAALDDHTLASRLSFFLWNSAPDAQLAAAAAGGGLRTVAGLAGEVERMLADPRAARARDDYYASWLHLDDLGKVARDARELTPEVVADLRRSALQGIADVYRSGGKVEVLLGSSALVASDGLAKVYGLPSPGGELRAVEAPAGQRRGLFTHPALLTLLANPDASDPIQRGLFLEEKVLCQATPDPIDTVPDLPPLRPGLSTRARLEAHRADPACAPCHRLFDPMGMALENYDAIGRYRTVDQGVPVDSSGEIAQGLDLDGKFANGMELLQRMSTSATVRDCMTRHWFEYAVSRALDDGEACVLEPIATRFRKDGDLRALLAGVASSDAFRMQMVAQD
jgi:hypothetical protein